jgi:hypothetical protein
MNYRDGVLEREALELCALLVSEEAGRLNRAQVFAATDRVDEVCRLVGVSRADLIARARDIVGGK